MTYEELEFVISPLFSSKHLMRESSGRFIKTELVKCDCIVIVTSRKASANYKVTEAVTTRSGRMVRVVCIESGYAICNMEYGLTMLLSFITLYFMSRL